MNEIQLFPNPEFGNQYCIIINGEPYFRAKELCASLGYSNSWDAIRKHVDKCDIAKREVSTPIIRMGVDTGKTKMINMNFVNESGMYSLIFGSALKTAKIFKRWVTSELLPKLRKNGRYELEQKVIESDAHNRHLLQRIKEVEKDAALSKDLLSMGKQLYVRDRVGDIRLFSASEIAKEFGVSTQAFNKKLAQMGIIEKEYGIWLIVERYRGYGYAKLDERSYKNRYIGCDVKVEIMKWTIEGVKFIISMWTGLEDDQVDKSAILSNLLRK